MNKEEICKKLRAERNCWNTPQADKEFGPAHAEGVKKGLMMAIDLIENGGADRGMLSEREVRPDENW